MPASPSFYTPHLHAHTHCTHTHCTHPFGIIHRSEFGEVGAGVWQNLLPLPWACGQDVLAALLRHWDSVVAHKPLPHGRARELKQQLLALERVGHAWVTLGSHLSHT